MKKLLIAGLVVAVFTLVYQVQAQTNVPPPVLPPGQIPPTIPSAPAPKVSIPETSSNSYILGASSKFMSSPFSGFGVDMTPGTCLGYTAIKSDITKITNLLATQIDQNVRSYAGASCNTQATLDATCIKHVDTINNLALTYATYQIDALRQAKDKAYICDVNNNRIEGKYKSTYYNFDFPAIAYASVRDAYAGKKYTDHGTLINTINTNITTKLNNALKAGKFTDVVPASAINTTYTAPAPATTTANGIRAPRQRVVVTPTQYTLRALAQTTFKTTALVRPPRQRVVAAIPSTTLSGPNMFLFFGLTSNTDINKRTIAAIPMDSLGGYVTLYNSNPTRFGEIYSATNKDLITRGTTILDGVNKRLKQGMPEMQTASLDTYTELVESNIVSTQSQTAYVGGAIGKLWKVISSFFMNVFGVKEAGAQSGSGSNRGSGSGVGVTVTSGPCPAMPVPRPKPTLSHVPDKQVWLFNNEGNFSNYYELNPEVDIVIYRSKVEYLDPAPKIDDDFYRHLLNFYRSLQILELDDTLRPLNDIKLKIDEKRKQLLPKNPWTIDSSATLSAPGKPYSCLRSFPASADLRGISTGHFGKANITVTANGQTAMTSVSGGVMRNLWVDFFGADYSKEAANKNTEDFNKRNDTK